MMKKFTYRVIIFVLLPVVVYAILYFIIQNEANKQLSDFKIKQENLIIGDSHTRFALDDSLIEHTHNISQISEGYIFTYSKLKSLNRQNRIKSVMLSYSYHNIAKYYDDYIIGWQAKHLMKNQFFALGLDEQIDLTRQNMVLPLKYSIDMIFEAFSKFDNLSENFIGSFETVHSEISLDTHYIHRRIIRQYNNKEYQKELFSEFNIKYLCKIVELCKEEKIDLVLVNTPLHQYYNLLIPAPIKDKYYRLVDSLGVKLIDLADFPLPDSAYLPDGDHLNQYGAEIFSKYINNQSITK